jgi:ATP-dependent Clp protease protease subunit
MKVFNLTVKKGADGSKHLDLQVHGVIDGGWWDEAGVDTADLVARLQEHVDAKTVGVRINSMGGSAFGGVALYNALQSHPGEVTCTVEGLAASAASLIAMAGKTCMGRGTMMMIHPPATIAMGNAAEMRKTADVLDKIQAALGEIYSAKTGKSAEEINALINAETWMTGTEAVSSGFADEVLGSEKEPDAADPNEPKEGDPEARGEAVVWNGVSFPRAALPAQILAMIKPAAAPPPVVASATPPPAPPAPAPISLADIIARAPEAAAQLRAEGHAAGHAEGHAAGASAERARLKAIDELPGTAGCEDIVIAAKYGDKPQTAAELAVAVLHKQGRAGAELLAQRQRESAPAARVKQSIPDNEHTTDEKKAAKDIAAFANQSR